MLIHGGYLEGTPADTAALLLKHFAFGWQGLESLNFSCCLTSQVRSSPMRARLMRGMPPPLNDRACGKGNLVDAGPRAAIDTIRQRKREPFVPAVVISGNYALAEWYGAGGGETLFESPREPLAHSRRWGRGARRHRDAPVRRAENCLV